MWKRRPRKPSPSPQSSADRAALIRASLPRLEMLKWVCTLTGVLGFAAWLLTTSLSADPEFVIHPLLAMSLGPVPVVLIFSGLLLVLACFTAMTEKALETRLAIYQLDSQREKLIEDFERILDERSSSSDGNRKA